jgi:DNA-binding LacI/PurR family transcriptional regulator
MPITQTDIARKLGVNQKTVSIAFGAAGRIHPDTRSKILMAARELGYQPNHLAAGLRGSRTRSVGVVWAFVDPWAGDAVIGLDVLERLQQRKFATYQAQHSSDNDVLCSQLDDFLARRVDAIVVQAIPSQLADPEVLARLKQAPAVVAVTREPVADFPGDLIIHDRDLAIRQVVDHFADTGRRRPAMALSIEQESNPPKFAAFAERCRERGINHDRMLIDLDFPTRAETHGQLHLDGFRRAFPDRVDVDAVFCFNDTGALYVMRELQDRGLRVPEDVAVVGFNDIEPGRIFQPPLATGDRKQHQVAQAVDRLLADRLADPETAPRQETIHMQFIRRQSAG